MAFEGSILTLRLLGTLDRSDEPRFTQSIDAIIDALKEARDTPESCDRIVFEIKE